MKFIKNWIYFIAAVLFITSCNTRKQQNEGESNEMTQESAQSEILVSPVYDSPEFPDAIIEMNAPEEGASVDAGKVKFSYEVTNYELKAQTSDATAKNCANSGNGQHIHLILNNGPYTAHYDPEFEMDLTEGHYVCLSFLSRSYHESLKSPEAFDLRQFNVGSSDTEDVDLSGPNLFYSRPKGTYSGSDTKKILLDFYLVNCTLSADGYKVRATINGQEFMLDEWVPYFVEGLPMGENTFKLELLDGDGNPVDGPYNSVERTITLSEQPA